MKEMAAAVAMLVVLTAGTIATRAYAPCWTWNLARAADVPARCVMHR
jgi:hypothetical protein